MSNQWITAAMRESASYGLWLAVMVGLLGAMVAVDTRQDAQAAEATLVEASSPALKPVEASDAVRMEPLDDPSLQAVRGRHVDAGHLEGKRSNSVILWDERGKDTPAAGSKSTVKSRATGIGNHQEATVTTRGGR
ncbi:hypothetical protein FHR95_002827 [Halomonas fontilapidosi]|uniref:Uncharacterized protein n=1 Tax=Halomonas fontilapidosi TaxID=616675 RepID=A0A7W5DLV8_9GAMM|nr:hypothetical protein [Halomonas fontilapidosi]MBB3185246.1 hypothetical protein [Halomonas fontilapidosi]